MEEHDSPDGALMAAGIVIVLALLGCVVMFLVAG
jgi:hypothetical protein